MSLQWFPGHMNAARKKVAETLARIDVVIEILDARLPEASANPMIRALRAFRQRPSLKVLNKADLADAAITRAWLAFYERQPGVKAIAVSCRPGKVDSAFTPLQRIPALCRTLAPHRNDLAKPLRMMIMGIPNVGKSTLMNALCKRRVAAVGDEPAITRNQQTLDLGEGMTLTDTPGLMWPKIERDADGLMLAASHAIGINAMIEEEVAAFLGELLLARYAENLAGRYGFDVRGMDGPALLEAIAEKRGCRLKRRTQEHAPDLEKAARILLTDYRSGALGRISLERPADFPAERLPPPHADI
ncbi:MAG: ribosome biogenesis GTPase YlqF [Zoogloeaceae bacterium]|jgi:ribosome biogenesis GTPase A|nr:ribosome biogenesis GTPase YlqF [Zoogloeaceae bacterium]